MAVTLIAPIYAVIVFVEMTVVLQDRMGSRGGGTWKKAAEIMAIPTGLVTLVMLIISLAGVVRRTRPRWVAIAAVVANVVALAVIVYGVMVV